MIVFFILVKLYNIVLYRDKWAWKGFISYIHVHYIYVKLPNQSIYNKCSFISIDIWEGDKVYMTYDMDIISVFANEVIAM